MIQLVNGEGTKCPNPVGQNRQKYSFFVNLIFKIKCHIVKNSLSQTAFSAIFGIIKILILAQHFVNEYFCS